MAHASSSSSSGAASVTALNSVCVRPRPFFLKCLRRSYASSDVRPAFLRRGYETSDVLQGADGLNACGEILLSDPPSAPPEVRLPKCRPDALPSSDPSSKFLLFRFFGVAGTGVPRVALAHHHPVCDILCVLTPLLTTYGMSLCTPLCLLASARPAPVHPRRPS